MRKQRPASEVDDRFATKGVEVETMTTVTGQFDTRPMLNPTPAKEPKVVVHRDLREAVEWATEDPTEVTFHPRDIARAARTPLDREAIASYFGLLVVGP
jgi:hypothetical protein